MFGLYTFLDWNDAPHVMRASTIHKKVMEASKKSNYNWIAPATELLYVCSKEGFPVEYAIDIKACILNCYSSLMTSEEGIGYSYKTDIYAGYSAYNSLYGVEDENAIMARKNFLKSLLFDIIIISNSLLFIKHLGETFVELTGQWQERKLNELINIPNLDFDEIKESIAQDYYKFIKKAEEEGLFEEDDRIEEERSKKFIERIAGDKDDFYFIKNQGMVDKSKTLIK